MVDPCLLGNKVLRVKILPELQNPSYNMFTRTLELQVSSYRPAISTELVVLNAAPTTVRGCFNFWQMNCMYEDESLVLGI